MSPEEEEGGGIENNGGGERGGRNRRKNRIKRRSEKLVTPQKHLIPQLIINTVHKIEKSPSIQYMYNREKD